MSDYRRAIIPGGVFFFTVVTHDRAPVFTSSDQVDKLRAARRKMRGTRPFQMDAVAVLPDHLHCIGRSPEGGSAFSGRWREIKKAA